MRQGPAPFAAPRKGGAAGRAAEAGDPNVVALLSLKLLLLAFFILLTALARFADDKVALVVSSVNEAFQGQVRAERDHSTTPAALGPVDASTQLTRRVRNLFSSTLPLARIEPDETHGELRLELPTESLFQRDTARLLAGPAVLLDRLAGLLGSQRDAGLDVDLELLVGVEREALAGLARAPESLPLRRAGALARDLASRGLSGEQLSVGLLPGLEKRTRLVLRVRELSGAQAGGDA